MAKPIYSTSSANVPKETPDSSNTQEKAETPITHGGVSISGPGDIYVKGSIIGGNVTIGLTREDLSEVLIELSAQIQPKAYRGESPYVGLASFGKDEAHLFFGREQLVADLILRVRCSSVVFVTGASGNGKTSLLQAGLISALEQPRIIGTTRWSSVRMTPGAAPFQSASHALFGLIPELAAQQDIALHAEGNPALLGRWLNAKFAGDAGIHILWIVDQFEELFTQILDAQVRAAFIEMLHAAVAALPANLHLVLALRSDFIGNLAQFRTLNDWLNEQFLQVTPMSGAELERAITKPALQVGLRIDPDLRDQIVSDMQSTPDALSLMQFALQDLFLYARGREGVPALTLSDYLDLGGLRHALENRADSVLRGLDENELASARFLFSRMIQIEPDQPPTRRLALIRELEQDAPEPALVKPTLNKFAREGARLVLLGRQGDEGTATLIHEKLIQEWGWLQRLVNENREAIALQTELASRARAWQEADCHTDYLYSGRELEAARRKIELAHFELKGTPQLFMELSIQAENANRAREAERQRVELENERRARRFLTLLVVMLGIVLLIAGSILSYPYLIRWQAQSAMAFIPAGPAIIGTNDPDADPSEQPQMIFELESFLLDKYEITNEQYLMCHNAGPCGVTNDPAKLRAQETRTHPVTGVTAYDAAIYCAWQGKRLPTELEWERAARGANGAPWPWGIESPSPEFTNLFFVTTLHKTAPVGTHTKGRSQEGAEDLVGNVAEWTSSPNQLYSSYNTEHIWRGEVEGVAQDPDLIFRGGAWSRVFPRVTIRSIASWQTAQPYIGFRCAS